MYWLDDLSYEVSWKFVNFTPADTFTFDTEKIKDDLERIRESLMKKENSQEFITILQELLKHGLCIVIRTVSHQSIP